MSRKGSPNSIGYRKPIYLTSDDPRAITSDTFENFRANAGAKVIVKPTQTSFMDLDEYTIPIVVYNYWFGSLGASETFGNARSIEVDSNGNVYTLSGVFIVGGPRNMFLTKHDKNANLLWIKKISNSSTVAGNTIGLKIDSSNNIYLFANGTVVDTSVTYSRYILIKYDSNGTLLWKKQEQHNTTSGSKTWTEVRSLSIDSSGNIYVVGSRRTNTTRYASLVIKYDSSGTILWQKILVGGDTTYGNQGWTSVVDSSGNIYVISRYYPTFSPLTNPQLLIVKINSAGTAITWQKLLTAGTAAPYYVSTAEIDSLGNTYIISYGGTGGGSNVNFLTKYDSAGTRVWVKKITNAEDLGAVGYSDLVLDSSDNIYFVGGLSLLSTTNKPTIVKIQSTDGTIVWERLIDGTGTNLHRVSIDNINQKISIFGGVGSSTNLLVAEVPLNSDFTGTYVIPSNTYSAEITVAVSTITHTVITNITNTTSSNAATVLTAFSPALTDETAATTDENFTTYGWSSAGF